MNARSPRTLLWGASAALLLILGFAFFIAVAARLVSGDAESVERTRQGLAIYAGVVLLKGLLPQLVLTILFYRLVAERAGFETTRLRMAVGVAVCAVVSGAIVAGALLPLPLPGLPNVVYRGVQNFVATALEMAAAVTAAGLLPRWIVPALRRATVDSTVPPGRPGQGGEEEAKA